jgi:hypothetical protein
VAATLVTGPTCTGTTGRRSAFKLGDTGFGLTLRQIGAELGISSTTVSEQLRRAGVSMRRGVPPHPASRQQILDIRDRGLTWREVAEQVDMTVSGA